MKAIWIFGKLVRRFVHENVVRSYFIKHSTTDYDQIGVVEFVCLSCSVLPHCCRIRRLCSSCFCYSFVVHLFDGFIASHDEEKNNKKHQILGSCVFCVHTRVRLSASSHNYNMLFSRLFHFTCTFLVLGK